MQGLTRMAAYIASYYGSTDADVRSILNETKIGAWQKPALQKMLNTVFTTH